MDKDNIFKVRHSLAHLLAMAVLKSDPEAKLSIGPVIDNGFYYDIDFSEGKIPTDKDLKELQKQIKKLASSNLDFVFEKISYEEAKKLFANNPYKLELIEEINSDGKELTIYKTKKGDTDLFTDLCSGPHIENTKEINAGAFKLDKIAGAYWRGDEKNKMLTRIYGVAFETAEELENYEKIITEAANRDHRKIGKEMRLFTFSELVGSGLPLFTPKGATMRKTIVETIQNLQKKFGYQEVWIPHLTKPDLYKTSGHLEKFADGLFRVRGKESDFVMKPMNCPHHTQIYASEAHSYKDLPIRFMEATTCYRDEQSGELLGLSRVRSLTQDDGHVFCRPDQIKQEVQNIISVIRDFYTKLSMWKDGSFRVVLSVSDPKHKEKYLGGDEIWQNAEKILAEIAEAEKLPVSIGMGEAAFYGPKLDFMFKDAIGREWQLATVQLDFNMPVRFELEYVDSDGKKKTPVMIHRAIAGSLERFLSVIIEHFAGEFPFWLAPVQIKLIPVAENHNSFAKEIADMLLSKNIRVEIDDSKDSLGKKIRNVKTEKIPFYAVIGDQEFASKNINLENRSGEKKAYSLDEISSGNVIIE